MNDIETDDVLDITDLSAILKKSVATIRSDMVRKPEAIPPSFKFPGCKKSLWLKPTVVEFVRRHAEGAGALPQTK